MSAPNENEPDKSQAPIDPGPPEWLKAANAAKPPKRNLFPKSTIGQSPRSSIGMPVEPARIETAPAEPAPVAPAPVAPSPFEPAPAEPARGETAPESRTETERPAAFVAPADVTPSAPPRYSPKATPTPAPAPAYSNGVYSNGTYSNTVYSSSVYSNSAAPAGNGLSLTSLILGCASVLLSFVYLGFFPALAAVIIGHIAQRRQRSAKALWLTGLITGYLSLVVSIVFGGWIALIFIQAFSEVNAG